MTDLNYQELDEGRDSNNSSLNENLPRYVSYRNMNRGIQNCKKIKCNFLFSPCVFLMYSKYIYSLFLYLQKKFIQNFTII